MTIKPRMNDIPLAGVVGIFAQITIENANHVLALLTGLVTLIYVSGRTYYFFRRRGRDDRGDA